VRPRKRERSERARPYGRGDGVQSGSEELDLRIIQPM